jgi:hypothetical protein
METEGNSDDNNEKVFGSNLQIIEPPSMFKHRLIPFDELLTEQGLIDTQPIMPC